MNGADPVREARIYAASHPAAQYTDAQRLHCELADAIERLMQERDETIKQAVAFDYACVSRQSRTGRIVQATENRQDQI